MTHTIIPAIIPTSKRHLDTMLHAAGVFAESVQVDIVDGVFAPSASWPYADGMMTAEALAVTDFCALSVELDLMVTSPERTLDQWLRTRPARVVVHIESVSDLSIVLAHAGSHAYQLGIALGNDTDLSMLNTIDRSCVDFVQLMGIEAIGAQGNSFDSRVLARIREVKMMWPSVPVSIDGSVNAETLPKLREAGADRFVVGSAIWNAPEPARAFQELVHLAQ